MFFGKLEKEKDVEIITKQKRGFVGIFARHKGITNPIFTIKEVHQVSSFICNHCNIFIGDKTLSHMYDDFMETERGKRLRKRFEFL